MAPASLQLTLFEPIVFLRGQSAVGEDARGRRRPINFDAPPSQLRGLLIMNLPKSSKINEISILLQGRARTDWPEGIGPNRLDMSEESIIFSQKIVLFPANDAQPGQPRRRASSVGAVGLLADETREDRRRMDRSFHTAVSTTSSTRTKVNEGERNATLARSLGQAAARAGTAILPPTLVRELNASKQNSASSPRSASSSPLRSPSSTRLTPSRTSSQQSNSYFDPPPLYGSGQFHHHQPTSSSSSDHSSPALDEHISCSAPSGLSDGWRAEGDGGQAAPTAARTQHPQSINAAGPSNRSILHASGRQEARQQSSGLSGVGVRFDPQPSAEQHAAFNVSTPVSVGHHSEPTSTRASVDHGNGGPSSKGKGKAIGSSPSPGAGTKKGIKGLLGNLLKEDDEVRSSATSSAMSSSSSISAPTTPLPGALDDDEGNGVDCKDFRKGVYTFPFSIPLPSNLPPTLHADFGSNAYLVRAHVHRAGPLTPNLTCDKEITLVHAPDEDGQDENDAIVVERNWDDCLRYIILVTGKTFPVGSKIPVWVKFVPTEKIRVHRIIATLEERTAYFAKGRRVARHEVPRRWNLLKLVPPDSSKDGILPIVSEASDALLASPVYPFAEAASRAYGETSNVDPAELISALMDPVGPWELAMDLEVPSRGGTLINISTNHKKSNIAVSHLVKLAIRVEKIEGDAAERKLFDILIEAPVTINHSHTAHAWLSLPDYWSVRDADPSAGQGEGSTPVVRGDRPGASSVRRQTAPSLVPSRFAGSTRIEAVARPTSPPSPTPPPLQGRVNSSIVQLSQQWLSLSTNGNLATTGSSVTPLTAQQQEDMADSSGLPTYAMIDGARGSVDLPSRSGRAIIK